MRHLCLACLLCVIVLFGELANGAPPPGFDPALSEFYQGLKIPGTSLSCCSQADCRPVIYRITSRGYEALVTPSQFYTEENESKWVEIPADKILEPRNNPVGEAVLCWTQYRGVLCFLPAAGT